MNFKTLLAAAMLLCAPFAMNGGNPAHQAFKLAPGANYQKGTIILKVKPDYRSFCSRTGIASSPVTTALTMVNCTSVQKIFPQKQQPLAQRNAMGQQLVDLSLIYEATIDINADIEKTINQLMSTGMLQYAEPRYIYNAHYTPNDPSSGGQYALTKIQAYAGWDISKGDTSVVIGIVDSGTDWNHPDLQNNIKYNYADPINGTDDDNDGFTDNYRGWDVSENDNDPMIDQSPHGSHVSGCAAASTDNGVGVASPGFNCKFLAVKCANATATTTIDHGYEGIVYAADHGCQVINCSWGGAGAGQYGQDAVTYATINMNVTVFCSAGNTSTDIAQYPSAYQYAYSIASTNSGDNKSGFSTWNYTVDMCAPGSNIYSTYYNNTYANQSGTSMASPIAAGCAGVVKAMFPSYNAQQIGEQLKMTADNIYGVGTNGNYAGKLGTGRINLFRALTESPQSVKMDNLITTDYNDNAFVFGDTLNITGDIINYLAPLTNLTVTLTSTSGYVTVLDGTTNPGAMATMSTLNNNADPFTVKINTGAPLNSKVTFKINCSDGTYSTDQYFDVVINVDYINVTVNDVSTSITSKGRHYYNDGPPTQGLGFIYNSANLVYDGGLMIGVSATRVSDMVRDAAAYNNDFASAQVVQIVNPTVASDFDLYGKFNDNNAPAATRLNVLVTHKTFAWTSAGNRKFVIVEYNIKNNGTASLSNLYSGIFSDWDVPAFGNNKADVDNTLKMGYTYSTDAGGAWAGVKLLTQGGFKNYAIDNVAGGSGGVDITDDFTDAEKYTTLSTNRAQAGGTGTGMDVCQTVSSGPFTIAAGDSVIVAFALIAGDDLNDIQTSATNAQIKYDGITTAIHNPTGTALTEELFEPYPNPANGNISISFITAGDEVTKLDILDVVGKEIMNVNVAQNTAGLQTVAVQTHTLGKGVYFVRLTTAQKTFTSKFVLE